MFILYWLTAPDYLKRLQKSTPLYNIRKYLVYASVGLVNFSPNFFGFVGNDKLKDLGFTSLVKN
jgi:hypothetical protein